MSSVAEVIFEVTSVFISVLESENSSLHLRQLKFAFKLLAIAEVEDTSALEVIVDKLALVVVPSGRARQLSERTPVEVHEWHRAVIEGVKAVVDRSEFNRASLAALQSIEVHR